MENNNIVDNRGEKPDKISGLIKNKKNDKKGRVWVQIKE